MNGSNGNLWAKYFNPKILTLVSFDEDRETVEDELFNIEASIRAKTIYFLKKEYYIYRKFDSGITSNKRFGMMHLKGRVKALDVIKDVELPDKKAYINIISNSIFRQLMKLRCSDIAGRAIEFANAASKIISSSKEYNLLPKINDADFRYLSKLSSFDVAHSLLQTKEFLNLLPYQKEEVEREIIGVVKERESKRFSYSKYLKYRILSWVTFGSIFDKYNKKYERQKILKEYLDEKIICK